MNKYIDITFEKCTITKEKTHCKWFNIAKFIYLEMACHWKPWVNKIKPWLISMLLLST